MKPLLLLALVLFFVPIAVQGQVPNAAFVFSREANDRGSTDYVLRPMTAELQKKAGGVDRPYQALGVLARPSTNAAVLLFANAQRESQLYTQNEKKVLIKADGFELSDLEYVPAARTDEETTIKLEIVNVLIKLPDLQKIAAASAVTVWFGKVSYRLDKDNLEGLRYIAAEIRKDEGDSP